MGLLISICYALFIPSSFRLECSPSAPSDLPWIDLLPALWFLHLDRRERKVGPLEPMAELLAQRCFLSSSSGHACLSRSREQRESPAFVALRRSGFHGRTLALGAPRGKLLRGRVSSVPVQVRGGFKIRSFAAFVLFIDMMKCFKDLIFYDRVKKFLCLPLFLVRVPSFPLCEDQKQSF